MYYKGEFTDAIHGDRRSGPRLGRVWRRRALWRAQWPAPQRHAAFAAADAREASPDPAPPRRGLRGLLMSMWEFFWLFMEMSSIHGFSHITTKNRDASEHIMWLVVMALGLAGAVGVGLSTWERYQDNPTVISMDRDFQEWNMTFPAATVCTAFKYDGEKVNETIEKLPGSFEDKEAFLTTLMSATYDTFHNFKDVKNYFPDSFKPADYQQLYLENSFKLAYNLANSFKAPLAEVYPALLEMGLCYTYNSEIAAYQDPGLWAGKKDLKLPIYTIKVNAYHGLLFMQMMDMNSHATVYIHGPEEIPDIAFRQIELPQNTWKGIDGVVLNLYTTDEARSLRVRQRRCRFTDESDLKLTSVYSYNLCRMECRMRQANNLCKCIPFFYRNSGNYKVCDPQGMLCLARHEESLIRLLDPATGEKIPCNCLPNCDSQSYIIELESNMPWFMGPNLKWGLVNYPQMRLKRDVIFSFTDVLVSIGGTAGLFLGCSILSFIEIIYFFTLHLFWYIVRKIKK